MSKIVFIIIVVVIIVGAIYYEKQRGDDLSITAKRLGFDFQPGQHRLPAELEQVGFDLFTQGPPNIRNRMQGIKGGRDVTIFDFTYNASSAGEGQRGYPVADDFNSVETRSQSVIWIRSGSSLPDFDLSPSRIHRRSVGQRFGLQRVTFDGRNSFNQQFTLLARDDQKTRVLFKDAVFDYLADHPHLVFESRGRDVLFYRFEKLPEPDSIPRFLEEAEALLELLQRQ
ncbi:MAG: hypothetical protein KDI74_13595 [Gammaproteobacteria bacterium]|nr:hypothetical protein [Gammaproteobacteria bacterium]